MEGFTIANIIKVGIQRGLKNLVPVLVNTVLWIVTIWIPYLNVGTTIGLWVGVIAKMSRDEEISMTEIFNPAYRKRMGQYFLVWGFMMAGIMMGMIFLYIPGIVIAIAWMLAPLLVIDKEVNPIEAINQSNNMTYGKKWTIFLGMLILDIAAIIALFIIFWILGKIFGFLGFFGTILMVIVYIVGYALFFTVLMAAYSFVYGSLSK
jgi:hypothetical protein